MIASRVFRARATRIVVAILALVMAGVPQARADYKLGTLDRVKVKVHEWPDMDGEYTVSDKGMVSLPLIGDIPAAGHDVQELARTISARLEERSGGAEKPRDLPIPGRELNGIHFAMDFLPQQNRRVSREPILVNEPPILASGKHVVVTGAASGLGLAIAEAAQAEGAIITAIDRVASAHGVSRPI